MRSRSPALPGGVAADAPPGTEQAAPAPANHSTAAWTAAGPAPAPAPGCSTAAEDLGGWLAALTQDGLDPLPSLTMPPPWIESMGGRSPGGAIGHGAMRVIWILA